MRLPLELQSLLRARLPVILAAEGSECGLVCIAIVAAYYGRHETLNDLRQQFPLSMSGARLRDLMVFADSLGLPGRAVKAEIDDLRGVRQPLILHWGFNHFVVLKEFRGDRVTIHDPSVGVRRIPVAEFSRHYTGVALELTPAANFERQRPPRPRRFRTLLPSMPGFVGSLSQVLALSLALMLCAFALPFQIQLVVDEAITNLNRDVLGVIACAFGGLIILQVAVEGLRNWTVQVLGGLFTFQVVGNLIRHILRLPTDFFAKRHVGDVMSRLSSTAMIQDLMTRGLVSAIIDGVMAIVAAAILFFYSADMAAIVALGVVINFIIAMAFYVPSRVLTEERLHVAAIEQTYLMETIRAAPLIKVMGAEAQRESTWRNLYTRVVSRTLGLARLSLWSGGLQAAVNGLQVVLLIYIGAHKVLDGAGLSIGMLLSFLAFRQTFADRATALIAQVVQVRMAGLHLERLSEIVDAKPEWSAGPLNEIQVEGRIELRNVWFRYGISDPWVLQDVSLTVEPGEFLAIVGSTGGGKTTLLKLMMGLHPPTSGEILLDGERATPDLWRQWRAKVGLVAQDDYPMTGTVATNIAFFDAGMDMARVTEAAKRARIHDEVMTAPMQYMHPITEGGGNISGGQRQRLLLARALYRRPSILILDEGTANLDLATEEQIANLVCEMPITRIVVAHRPALVARADRVVEVERKGVRVRRAAPDEVPQYGAAE